MHAHADEIGLVATRASAVEQRLLALVRALALELHPQAQSVSSLGLDHSIERDFGLDSLARVELSARLEREFGVRLPERAFAEAETARDFLQYLGTQPAVTAPSAIAPKAEPVVETEHPPLGIQTLLEALDWHVQHHAERTHIMLHTTEAAIETISYGTLRAAALALAAGLRGTGVERGQNVAIMLPTGGDFFTAFYGVLYAGAVPVPLYPPARLSQLEEHLRRIAGILGNAGATTLITFPAAKPFAQLLRTLGTRIEHVASVTELRAEHTQFTPVRPSASDTAFLQYTSGSTGSPKGVILSHANLLANLRAMAAVTQASSRDVFVSWLPLYHDMGLIGACLGTMMFGFPLALMSPLAFLSRPVRWLRAIQQHAGTITAAPNFAYEFCLNKIDDAELEGLDLSSLRLAFNGAEPVSPDTLERFSQRYARYGFAATALTPVYGLAECSVGLAFPPLGRGPLIDRISRATLMRSGTATPARGDDPHPLRVVSCGAALLGHALRVVDSNDHALGDRVQGRIQFRGPSATRGYFANPAETKRLVHGDWLDSGDLGYLVRGEVYITGRAKDIIIRGGQNIHPQELEEAVAHLPGVRKGGVVAFPATDARSATERLIVLAETRLSEASARQELREAIARLTVDLIGLPADDIVLAPPRTVLKTSSGKTRRAACRELYERGQLGRAPRSAAWQIVRLTLSPLTTRLTQWRRSIGAWLWSLWAASVFGLLVPFTWLLLIGLPRQHTRRAAARRAARLALLLCAVKPEVRGLELLPERAAVIVANHGSYLDSLVLTAVLPPTIAYAAKRELASQFFAGLALRRLGAVFVERADPARGAEDTAGLERALHAGDLLVVYPEGTFRRDAGLLPFHMGAFLSAAVAGAPVVPLTLHGVRTLLPAGRHLPRRSKIEVLINAPLMPEGTNWQAALRVRDRARAQVLAQLGEPDLEHTH